MRPFYLFMAQVSTQALPAPAAAVALEARQREAERRAARRAEFAHLPYVASPALAPE